MERHGSRRWRGSYKRRRKKPWNERLADWTRAFIAFLFSNVGIICLVVGYTVAGAVIFQEIEGQYSLGKYEHVKEIRKNTTDQLWELTTRQNIFSEENWKEQAQLFIKSYQEEVVKAAIDGYDGLTDKEYHERWSFAGAFLYSLTVITTIGYGNITPRTEWGKIVTVGYAIAGMPLFLLYLSNIGDILARSFKWTYARFCLCRCRRRARRPQPPPPQPKTTANPAARDQWQMVNMHRGELETSSLDQDSLESSSDEDDDEDGSDDSYDPQQVTVPLTLCLAIMVGYVCGGALLFSMWEDWDTLNGSYFCFISLSTIGFGDFVPGDQIYSPNKGFAVSFFFCSMYLMLGMALIAMCFNLMQEEVIAKVRTLARTVRRICRCDR